MGQVRPGACVGGMAGKHTMEFRVNKPSAGACRRAFDFVLPGSLALR